METSLRFCSGMPGSSTSNPIVSHLARCCLDVEGIGVAACVRCKGWSGDRQPAMASNSKSYACYPRLLWQAIRMNTTVDCCANISHAVPIFQRRARPNLGASRRNSTNGQGETCAITRQARELSRVRCRGPLNPLRNMGIACRPTMRQTEIPDGLRRLCNRDRSSLRAGRPH